MNIYAFKYKNDRIFNILSFVFFIFFSLIVFIIFGSDNTTLYKILFLLISFIGINLMLIFISKCVCITMGTITFDKHSFIYESLNNEYTINYQEIEYISKESYIDSDSIIRKENYYYKIKIKNAGYFIFNYYDDSLDKAINELAIRSKKEIDE